MKKSVIALSILIAAICLKAPLARASSYSVTVFLSAFSNDYMTAEDYVIANTGVKVNGLFRLLPHDTNWYGNGKVFTGTPGYVQGGYHVFYLNHIPDFYQTPPVATNIANDGASTLFFRPYSNSLMIAVTGQAAGVSVPWTISAYPAEFTNASSFRTSGTNTTLLTPIPTGTYAVAFPLRLKGYSMPSATNIEVSAARHTAITNWYLPYLNVLAVTIAGLATTNNSSWSLTGPDEITNAVNYATTYTNVFTVEEIPDGLYAISFPTVLGYSTPPVVYTNLTETPLTNYVLGTYVAVTWGGATNPSATNPPVGTVPTNFPVQTNDITLMVDTNGLFKTPSREKIIAANGLSTGTQVNVEVDPYWAMASNSVIYTNNTIFLSITNSMTNWVPVNSETNWLSYDEATRTLSGCLTNGAQINSNAFVMTNDAAYLSITNCLTNYITVSSPSNYLVYDPSTRTLTGCLTNGGGGEAYLPLSGGTLVGDIHMTGQHIELNRLDFDGDYVNIGWLSTIAGGESISIGHWTYANDGVAIGPYAYALPRSFAVGDHSYASGDNIALGAYVSNTVPDSTLVKGLLRSTNGLSIENGNANFGNGIVSNMASFQPFSSEIYSVDGTATITYASGSLVKLVPNNTVIITFDNSGFPTDGVSRVSLEIATNAQSISFATATITNPTAYVNSATKWNTIFFRRTATNLWEGRQ